jgi:hypothetical protein
MPRRAICGVIPRSLSACRQNQKPYPLSASNLLGRFRSRPRGQRMSSIASTVSSSILQSWMLAAECVIVSGIPCRSTTRWRFEPDFPRSVGFGPVFSPSRGRERSPSRARPATNRSAQIPRDGLATPSAPFSILLLLASHVGVASKSCHCHTPFPGAATPKECLCAARKVCQ